MGVMFDDAYFEPAGPGESSLRERGSRFFGFAFPVVTELEAKIRLEDLRKKFPDATHHCYAMILGADKSYQKSTDDGEPTHSAGKPVLRAILATGLTNVLVVVVRYFGGTQLGIPGLIQAYGQAAQLALEQVGRNTRWLEVGFEFSCKQGKENEIYRLLQQLQARISETRYELDGIVVQAWIKRNQEAILDQKRSDFFEVAIKAI